MLSSKDKGLVLMILNHCDRIIDKIKCVNEQDFYTNDD